MIRFVSTTPVQTLLPDALDRPNKENWNESRAQTDQMSVYSHQSKTSAPHSTVAALRDVGWGALEVYV